MNANQDKLSFLRLRYSPFPLEAYVRTDGKFRIGPGSDARLLCNPAAWNIYWLSYPGLEEATDLEGVREPIYSDIDPLVGPAIETASQRVKGTTVGELATLLPALTFVQLLGQRRISHLALARLFTCQRWLDVMEQRASLSPVAMTPGLSFPTPTAHQ